MLHILERQLATSGDTLGLASFRLEAEAQAHRAAKFMHLNHLREELEAEASTWNLLQFLFCYTEPAAGLGGPIVQAAGNKKTYRQRAADLAAETPELERSVGVLLCPSSLQRLYAIHMQLHGCHAWASSLLRAAVQQQHQATLPASNSSGASLLHSRLTASP
jgi:hypothetical protein